LYKQSIVYVYLKKRPLKFILQARSYELFENCGTFGALSSKAQPAYLQRGPDDPALLTHYRGRNPLSSMFPVTIIEACLFTFPGPRFAPAVVRVFRFIAFSQAFFKKPAAMTRAIMFLCLCF